jgi:ABC-type transport system involved in multi-copper enzyme maturation permease subunit
MFLCAKGAASIWIHGIAGAPAKANWQTAGIFAQLVQLSFGLLMIAAVAPMSMSEERQRGSLDLLTSTTLSSREIVVGKWLGTFRLVLLLLVGPVLVNLALATGEINLASVPLAMQPTFQPPSLRHRLAEFAIVPLTIMAHGALATSVGLMLAIWMKRQSRAIAISVCVLIILAIGLPLVAAEILVGPSMRNFGVLSPLIAVIEVTENLGTPWRYRDGQVIPSILFWNAEAITLAAGLLWLSVRSFDLSLGRIPERVRKQPLLADVVIVLAAMLSVGCLAKTLEFGISGLDLVATWRGSELIGMQSDVGSLIGISIAVVVSIALVLVGVVPSLSLDDRHPQPPTAPLPYEPASERRLVVQSWRRTYAIVILRSAGPALLAIALATARPNLSATPRFTMTNGKAEFRALTPDERTVMNAAAWQAPLGRRLEAAALVALSILSLGAAVTGIGVLTSLWIHERTRRIIASIAASLICVWGPLFASLLYLLYLRTWPSGATQPLSLGLMSLVGSHAFLFDLLFSRLDESPDLWSWVIAYNGAALAVAVGSLWLAYSRTPRTLGAILRRSPTPGRALQ